MRPIVSCRWWPLGRLLTDAASCSSRPVSLSTSQLTRLSMVEQTIHYVDDFQTDQRTT